MNQERLSDNLDDDWDDEDEDTQAGKYLTFRLHGEDYGVAVAFVTQIIGMQTITPVPDMPDFLKGVINLRGRVVPVVDMRNRFNLPEIAYDDRTCIIVVTINEVPIGLVVDAVHGMVDIPDTEIEPPPRTHRDGSSRFLQGLGKASDGVKILLNVERLLYDEELQQLAETPVADAI